MEVISGCLEGTVFNIFSSSFKVKVAIVFIIGVFA